MNATNSRTMGIRLMAAAGLAAIVLTGCANESDTASPQDRGQGTEAVAGAKGNGPALPSNLPSNLPTGQAGGSGGSGQAPQVYTGGEAAEPPSDGPNTAGDAKVYTGGEAAEPPSDGPNTAGDANESAHLEAPPGSPEGSVAEQAPAENPNTQGEGGDTEPQQENPNPQGEGGAANTRPDQTVPLLDLERGITSPSGNIVCRTTGGDELGCALKEFSFTPPENTCPAGEPQEWKWGQLITLTGGDPEFACAGPAPTSPEGDAALPYGNTATDGRFVCLSEESGMACADLETVTGFRISKGSYDELTPSDIAMIDAG